MVYASVSAATQGPSRNVKYPIVLGESIVKPCSSRKFVNIKCSGLPRSTMLRAPGVLTPNNHGCSLELGTSIGDSHVVRVACKRQRSLLYEHDLVLVFHDDKFWLERVDHTYVSCGSAKLSNCKKLLPEPAADEIEDDPDSWMQTAARQNCWSPLTPEKDDQSKQCGTESDGEVIEEEEVELEVEMELETASSSGYGSCIETAEAKLQDVARRERLGRSKVDYSQHQSGETRGFLCSSEDSDSQCISYNSSDYTDASSDND